MTEFNIYAEFFKILEKRKIPFFLLSYRNLNDLSIIINEADFILAKYYFWHLLNNSQAKVIKVIFQNDFLLDYFLILDDFIHTKKKIRISILGALNHFRQKNLDKENDFLNFDLVNIFGLKIKRVLPRDEYLYMIYKLFIKNQKFNCEFSNNLEIIYNKDVYGCQKNIGRIFSKVNTKQIINCFKESDHKQIKKFKFLVLRRIYLFNFFNLNFRKIINNLKFFIKKSKANGGINICVLGPDGSGKSTLINELFKMELPFKSFIKYHFIPVKFFQNKDNVDTSRPHQLPPYGFIKSIFKIIYLFSIFYFFYLPKVFFPKKSGDLILFDRYLYDIFIDKKRYRLTFSAILEKFLFNLIPKNDLIFILTLNPRLIDARGKLEVPIEESFNLFFKYKLYANKIENSFIIDNSKSLEAMKICVFKKITSFIHKKNSSIYF